MDEVKSNVSYECKKCGAKGTLLENWESINLNEIKKLPCGCPGKTAYFKSCTSDSIMREKRQRQGALISRALDRASKA